MLMVRCQKMLHCRADRRKRNIAAPPGSHNAALPRRLLNTSELRQCRLGLQAAAVPRCAKTTRCF